VHLVGFITKKTYTSTFHHTFLIFRLLTPWNNLRYFVRTKGTKGMWLKSRAAEIFTFRNTRGGNWPQKCYKSYRGPTKTHANHHIQGLSEHKWNNVTSLQLLRLQLVYKSAWFKHWEVHSCGLHTFFQVHYQQFYLPSLALTINYCRYRYINTYRNALFHI